MILDGKEYTLKETVDLSKYPNVAKYTKREFYVQGARGCMCSLSENMHGVWVLIEYGVSRCKPRTRIIQEVILDDTLKAVA